MTDEAPERALDVLTPLNRWISGEAHGVVLDALAVRTRRTIFELLSEGEMTVRDLAECCDVSQQAVAKHLAFLQFAGLVSARAGHCRGVKNYWRARPQGAQPLIAWLLEASGR